MRKIGSTPRNFCDDEFAMLRSPVRITTTLVENNLFKSLLPLAQLGLSSTLVNGDCMPGFRRGNRKGVSREGAANNP